MNLSDFEYDLPAELIAQEPPVKRTDSRLMVLDRRSGNFYHRMFPDLLEYLHSGDLLVFNDTKVIPARLIGNKEQTGGKVEILLVRHIGENRWEALVKPAKRIQPGHCLVFGNGELKCRVIDRTQQGERIIEFNSDGFMEKIFKLGQTPLPPYIKSSIKDVNRYQTIFARHYGSSAAPTAALHFDETIFNKLKQRGIQWVFITLHIGPGTFRPVKSQRIVDHKMHREYFHAPQESLQEVLRAKIENRRVIPVGTTAVRTLESVFDDNCKIIRNCGFTDIFIYPGYRFKCADALITNFHLPQSTLLMLVCAFAGIETVLSAYREAVKMRYRFFSFGDCMLII